MGPSRYLVVDLDMPGIVRIHVSNSEAALERDAVLLVEETDDLGAAEVMAHGLSEATKHWTGVVERGDWALVFDVSPWGGARRMRRWRRR